MPKSLIFFSRNYADRGGTPFKKFQKLFILAFETNKQRNFTKLHFFRILAHFRNLGKRVLNESYCFANYMIEQQLSSESRDGVSRYVFLTSILYLEILREITHDINIPIWISHQYIY